MINYFIGIDGGGTKTDFIIANKNSEILQSITLGPTNPNDSIMERVLATLSEGLEFLCDGLTKSEISVFAGLAGASNEACRNQISEHISKMGFGNVSVGVDAQNAVAASLGMQNGIMVIMGTGSIAFTQVDQKSYRTGGFGYLFDDMGSGYEIGREAILSALKVDCGYAEHSILTDLVKRKCGHEKLLPALSEFYSGGKKYIASFAPLVFEAFKSSDDTAKHILKKNMRGIAELIIDASRDISDDIIKVRLCGGITRHENIVIPLINEALGEKSNKFDITICNEPQVNGALLLAKNAVTEENDDDKDRNEK